MYIVAPNIKSGGGLELLEYLIKYIEVNYPNYKYIVYVDSSLQMINSSDNIEVVHMNSSLEKIKLFTKKIDNVLYFGNLPPMVKVKNSVVYFHNSYLLMSFRELFRTSIKFFVKFFLQQLYIRFFIKNADIIACQNIYIKNKFMDKYGYKNVSILPFFRLCDKKSLKTNEIKYDFCYVSLAYPHKNHRELLKACDILSEENISFSLALTIEDDQYDLIEQINYLNKKQKINIINLGKITKDEVCKLYSESRCLIFPSIKETFGLALVEAVNMDLDVIASDLDYVYESVEPSLVFDSNSSFDISQKIKKYLEDDVKRSKVKIENKIDELIKIFIKENKNV